MKIIPSKREGKKYTAYFMLDNGKEKAVHFGSKGMRDFTLINNPKSKFYLKTKAERDSVKNAYIRRHQKRENWNNPLSAGSLSKNILWNKTTFSASIRDFKNKFKL